MDECATIILVNILILFVIMVVMTLSLIGRLEIGYISLEVKVRDLVNGLY